MQNSNMMYKPGIQVENRKWERKKSSIWLEKNSVASLLLLRSMYATKEM